MQRAWLGMLVTAAACNAALGGEPAMQDGAGAGDAAPVDTSPDTAVLGPWGQPALFPGASGAASEDDPSLSRSADEMVFAIADPADGNNKDLYYTRKQQGQWTQPVKLALSLTGSSEETPRFSADDLTLYFASNRAGTVGSLDIFKVTRTTIGGAWSTPAPVAGPNTAQLEKWFMPCAQNSSYLVIAAADLAEGVVGGAAPTVSAILSSDMGSETGSFLTDDCLTTYFASTRAVTNKLYTSTRASLTSPWSSPTELTELASGMGDQEDPWEAIDRRTFVFVSNVSGTKDVYISTR